MGGVEKGGGNGEGRVEVRWEEEVVEQVEVRWEEEVVEVRRRRSRWR